jgi:trimethylamine--corrinoid protein Co-methyltransferase
MKITTSLAQRLRHSTKFLGQGHANHSWEWDLRLAKATRAEIMIPAFQVASPLSMSQETVECGFRSLEYGLPAGVDTGPLFGATAPATLAGALGLVLIQLKRPHSRALVWGFPNALNMRSGEPAVGTIANSLFTVACNQVWRDYGVPLRNTAPAYSKSKKIDFQNGFERAIPAMLSALSGASSVHLHGGIYGELSHSPIQSILDDDIAAMIGRFVEGIDVDDESLALELIHTVGPVPGQFLDTEHTSRLWQREQYIQQCTDSLSYPEWLARGKHDCIDYARARMEAILESHEIKEQLTAEQDAELDDILAEATRFYRERGDIE